MRPAVFAALAALTLLPSCAPMADGPVAEARGGAVASAARQCFNVGQVSNFRTGDVSRLYLRVGRTDVYQVNAAGACPDLDFANRLAVIPDGAVGGTRLCTGDWARVAVPGLASQTRVCRVRLDRRLTAEEVAALPANQRP